MRDKGHQGGDSRRDQHPNTAAAASGVLGFSRLTSRCFPLLGLLLLPLALLQIVRDGGGGLHRYDRVLHHLYVVEHRRGRVTFHQRVVAGVVVGEESPHVDAGRDRAALPLVLLVLHLDDLVDSRKRGCDRSSSGCRRARKADRWFDAWLPGSSMASLFKERQSLTVDSVSIIA
jgi:hypothetical protein